MAVVIETLGAQQLTHLGISILLDHQCTDNSALHLKVLRLLVAEGIFGGDSNVAGSGTGFSIG